MCKSIRLIFILLLLTTYYAQYAYRFSETQPDGRVVLKHDNDDDGEDAAGSRLAHLLQMREDDGVLVLVSRW